MPANRPIIHRASSEIDPPNFHRSRRRTPSGWAIAAEEGTFDADPESIPVSARDSFDSILEPTEAEMSKAASIS